MNAYTYEQIRNGQNESFEVTITSHMMSLFNEITGDTNPLHCDVEYAVSRGYSGQVVYGMLTASFYSTLAGVYLPGKYCLLQSVDTGFRSPVFIGDTLTVSGKVTEKNDAFHIIIVKAQIINQRGEKVSKATIQIGFQKGEQL